MPPSRIVLGAVVIGGATLLWWLVAGARLVALVDRVTTAAEGAATSPTEFMFDDANEATFEEPKLSFGDRQRIAPHTWRVVERPAGHLTLETSQGSIPLGPITRRWTKSPTAKTYEFAPEPGDVISFARRRSRLLWPRFLDINWLGGASARWGRYVYDRLVWRKASGAVLDVVWRDEQRFLASQGWGDQYNAKAVAARISGETHR